jgi:O-antigen/teichoic acid export membrane protein
MPVSGESALPDAEGDRFFRSSFALLLSNAASAGLGVIFWLVAAHLFSVVNVGYGAAEIAAMTLIASVSQFIPSTIFPRFLYASGSRALWVLRSGYAAGLGIALLAAVLFLLLSGRHAYIGSGLFDAVLFVVGTLLWVVFTIEDAALIGMRNTIWVPVENTFFSVVKLAALPLFAVVALRDGVFDSWIVPVILCIVPINLYLFRHVVPAHVARSEGRSSLPSRRTITNIIAGEYVGGVALIVMRNAPILIVVARLGVVHGAYFQTPWLVGTTFDFSLWTIAMALTAESGARPTMAHESVRKAVRLSVAIMVPSIIVLIVASPFFLGLMGGAYSQHGTRLLQCLALTMPFMGVNILYITFARMARRVRRVVTAQLVLALLVIGLTEAFIGPLGITGAGVAFLTGQGVLALAVLPSVVSQYRRQGMAPSFSAHARLVAVGEDQVVSTSAGAPGDSPVARDAGDDADDAEQPEGDR